MISSLKTTRFVQQFSLAEKFDKTSADCVNFTCSICLYSYWQYKLANQRVRIRPVIVKIAIDK